MKEQKEEKQNLEMGDVINRSEEFIEKNKKIIGIVIAVIVVVVLAVFGIKKWYVEPRNNEAQEDMFAAVNLFEMQDYDKALNGDDNFVGFLDIIDMYGSTKAGNLARYYAGICELRLGKYDDAIDHFKSYSGKDVYSEPLAIMLEGDAYAETEDYDNAVKKYCKAAEKNPDFIVAPTALYKAGLVYIKLGDGKKAVEVFNKIKTQYPESTESQEADKYISYAENM